MATAFDTWSRLQAELAKAEAFRSVLDIHLQHEAELERMRYEQDVRQRDFETARLQWAEKRNTGRVREGWPYCTKVRFQLACPTAFKRSTALCPFKSNPEMRCAHVR